MLEQHQCRTRPFLASLLAVLTNIAWRLIQLGGLILLPDTGLDTHAGTVVSLLIFRIRCLFFPRVHDSTWNFGYLLERYLDNCFRLQLYFARDTYGGSFCVSSLPSYHKRAISKRLCNTPRLSVLVLPAV